MRPFAAAPLIAVARNRRALDVAGVAHRDRHVFFGDQVLDADFAGIPVDELGAAVVAVLVAHVLQLADDQLHQQPLAAENRAQPLDRLQQLRHLVENLLPLEAGQPLQLHVENRLRLELAERELRHQAVARFRNGLRSADQLDDRVEVVERDLQPFEDVIARLGLAQLELRAADDDLAAEVDEALDELGEVQHLRAAADDGQHDDAEALLQLRVLVEVVQDHFRHFAALQLDDDAHAFAIGFVAKIRNAFDGLLADELGDLLDQPRLVHLIRNLGDDDRLLVALLRLLDRRLGAHQNRAAAGAIRRADARSPDDVAAGREVGALHELHQAVQFLVLVELGAALLLGLDRPDDAVDDFAQVVRRHVGRHADGDAGRAVDEQIRNGRRQHRRLFRRLVVVRDVVDGLLVEIRHHVVGERLRGALRCTASPRADRRRSSRSCPARRPAGSAC